MKIHPNWKQAVSPENLYEVADLVSDFKVRLKTAPRDLFRQVCGLNSGPLITRAYGEDIRDYPDVQEQTRSFSTVWE